MDTDSAYIALTSRANNRREVDILCLISVWQERSVAEILDRKDRNSKAYDIMVEKKDAAYNTRTAGMIRSKVKTLRQAYIRAKRR